METTLGDRDDIDGPLHSDGTDDAFSETVGTIFAAMSTNPEKHPQKDPISTEQGWSDWCFESPSSFMRQMIECLSDCCLMLRH